MDQRVAFIADWLRDEWTMTELAEWYGIQPQDGVQVGGAVPRGSRAGVGRAVARAEGAWPRDGRRGPRRGAGAAAASIRGGAPRNCGRCWASGSPRGSGRRRARWASSCDGKG